MCRKLGEKYNVANPLDAAPKVVDSHSTPNKLAGIGFGSLAPTPFSSADDNKKPPLGHASSAGFGNLLGGSSPSPVQSPVLGGFSSTTSSSVHSPFGSNTAINASAPSPFGSSALSVSGAPPYGPSSATPASTQPYFGSAGSVSAAFGGNSSVPAPAPFGSSTSTPASGFGVMSSHTLSGQTGASFSSPFGHALSPASTPLAAPTGTTATFLGKSAREMLTAFYQEKNPSKLSEVDRNLAKYYGKEEDLFRNLAKKYNVPLAAFGLSEAPQASGFGSTGIGMSASPGFGQPSTLGGGSTFGLSPSSFGGTPNSGFGAASSGQGFGLTSGASAFGSQGFGALAHAPAPVGFGSFGSPLAPSTSPFGAPRR